MTLQKKSRNQNKKQNSFKAPKAIPAESYNEFMENWIKLC